jgi:uncharacterized protein YgbK (DUF1537 family)
MAATATGVLTILADDLTGACDTGTLFAAGRPVPVTVWPDTGSPSPVRVVDTESRSVDFGEAARRVEAAAGAAPATRYFKKIDSTLRGPIGAEVDALLRATGAPSVVLTPAFPALGRTVVDRVLLIDGIPATDTALVEDPEYPSERGSSVVDRLRPDIDRPLAWIPLGHVRADRDDLSARLGRLRGTVTIADAETDEDLSALVDAALALDPTPLLVGSAGLARALALRLGLLAKRATLPPTRRWLIVAGSRHPATRRQVATARDAGLRVLTTSDTDIGDRVAVAAHLASEARRIIEREAFDLVAVTGGQTALALWQAFDADRVDLLGAPAPGLAFGFLRAPGHPALGLLTKAGGFGAPDLFVSLWEESNG